MHNRIVSINFINAAVALLLFSISCSRNPLEKAQNTEKQGNYAAALQLYAGALQSQAKTFNLPDKFKAQFIAPAAWEKELQTYSRAIAATTVPSKLSTDLSAAIARCSTHVRRQNALYQPKIQPLTSVEFLAQWQQLFVPLGSKDSARIAELGTAAFNQKISIIQIISEGTYTYKGTVLSNGFSTATRYALKPENSVFSLATKGSALLICQSEVTFSQNELWRSPLELMRVEIPAEPSLVTVKLHTQIWKK